MKKKILLGAFLAALLCVAGVAGASAAESGNGSTIMDNVYIMDINVSGMTKEEASAAVQDYADSLEKMELTLEIGDQKEQVLAGDLGLKWDNTQVVEQALSLGRKGNLLERYMLRKDLEREKKTLQLVFQADAETARAFLTREEERFGREAVDASMTREDGQFVITEGQAGITVNIEESIRKINAYFAENVPKKDSVVPLAVDVVEPKGSVAELQKVKDVLGTFNTVCGTGASGRIQNILTGTSRINGKIVYPGEQFSADAAMTPYTAEAGYALGGAFENGQVVQSYGGGVCQVSTTLYNAVLLAELEVTERSNHSMVVTYVPLSADAAIAGTWKDLKFVNNTKAPIYIEGYVKGGKLYFTIYGEETRSPGRKVVYESETLSTVEPQPTLVATGEPIGTIKERTASSPGGKARLWKIVYENGVEISREQVNQSVYDPTNGVTEIGTASDNPEAVAAINEAIESKDLARCEAVSEAYKDKPAEEPKPPEPQAPAGQPEQPQSPQAPAGQPTTQPQNPPTPAGQPTTQPQSSQAPAGQPTTQPQSPQAPAGQ